MAKLLKDIKKQNSCHDCGTSIGFEHEGGCDNEVCTSCHLQKLTCGCEGVEYRERWTGVSHEYLMQLCEDNNLYTKWEVGNGWVTAEMTDSDSQHDLNAAAQIVFKLKKSK